jgi:hypothetical protein
MKLIALRAFTYAKRELKAGDEFEAGDSDAHVLATVGHARRAEDPQTYSTRVMEAKRKRGRPRLNKALSA